MISTITISVKEINGIKINKDTFNSNPILNKAFRKFMKQVCDNLGDYLKKNKINAIIIFDVSNG